MTQFQIQHLSSVGSTMDEARAALQSSAHAHGHVIHADQQTAGRGRHERNWVSPVGNLYASIILQPPVPLMKAAELSIVMAIAVGEALSDLLPATANIQYKWPNDILVQEKKICGILLEAETGAGSTLKGLIVGIGVNCATCPLETQWPATSMAELGVLMPPEIVLERILTKVSYFYDHWLEKGLTQLRQIWCMRAFRMNQEVRVKNAKGYITGIIKDLSAEGALLLDVGGQICPVSSGEVFFMETKTQR